MKISTETIERIANDYDLTINTVKSIVRFVNTYGNVNNRDFIDIVEEICMLALEERVKSKNDSKANTLTTEEIAFMILESTSSHNSKPSKLYGYEEEESLAEQIVNEPLFDEKEYASSLEELLTDGYEGIRPLPETDIPFEKSYLETKNHRR